MNVAQTLGAVHGLVGNVRLATVWKVSNISVTLFLIFI